MERVAFLVERTGQRISCLLNPESVVIKRTAGVRVRSSAGGSLAGSGLKDDPLIYTGGGVTQMLLDLLFDVSLLNPAAPLDDVRVLTRPLFELTEGTPGTDGFLQPPVVRFVWGKQWNVPGVVTALAERLEYFTSEGAPQRSWLRMRIVRVSEPEPPPMPVMASPLTIPDPLDVAPEGVEVSEVVGGSEQFDPDRDIDTVTPPERLDEVSWRRYGDPRLWRIVAGFNNIANPFEVAAGTLLQLPPLSAFLSTSKREGKQ